MGRNRTPDAIAQLKGNPRKRKLARGGGSAAGIPRDASPEPVIEKTATASASGDAVATSGEVLPPETPSPPLAFDIPEFLTHDRERAIFKAIVEEFLPRNLVRQTDFNAVGRYATYMHMWIAAKEELAKAGGSNWYKTTSKHGEMLRRHPSVQDMLDFGFECRQAEPQLALTPLARNAIMQRFMRGGFDPLPPGPEERPSSGSGELPLAEAPSALGFLARAAAAGQA